MRGYDLMMMYEICDQVSQLHIDIDVMVWLEKS